MAQLVEYGLECAESEKATPGKASIICCFLNNKIFF